MASIKPQSIEQARDLLRPGTYEHDRDAHLRVQDGVLVRDRRGSTSVVLTPDEIERADWVRLAKERLGWPT